MTKIRVVFAELIKHIMENKLFNLKKYERWLGDVHIIRHTVYGGGGCKLWRGVTRWEGCLPSALRHTLNVYPRNLKKSSEKIIYNNN